jgi:hypothetical protein
MKQLPDELQHSENAKILQQERNVSMTLKQLVS